MRKTTNYILYILLFAFGIVVDRISKILAVKYLADGKVIPIIKDVLEFVYLENRGAAFGMMQGKQTLFYIITVLVMCVIIYILAVCPQTKKYSGFIICLVLIASGAIGNFIDRVMQNYVVDFIYFKPINFPVFNIADCFVTLCTIILAFIIIFDFKEEDFNFITIWKSKSKTDQDKE